MELIVDLDVMLITVVRFIFLALRAVHDVYVRNIIILQLKDVTNKAKYIQLLFFVHAQSLHWLFGC